MLRVWRYRFIHWLFQWKVDDDGDICFVIANRLAFVKYKEHTVINLKGHRLDRASKYQGHVEPWRP